MGGDERLQRAVQDAVRETMEEAEADMRVRVRKGNRDEVRATGNMVGAGFFHEESRTSKSDGLSEAKRDEGTCDLDLWFDRAPRDVEVNEDVVGLGSYGKTLTVPFAEDLPDDLEDDEED